MVVVILPVLSSGLRVCELTVRIDESRRAEVSWEGRPFAEARWVGSGLSHVYALAGGPVVPPGSNAPDQLTIDRALLEIEIAAQSAVRAMTPQRVPVRRPERAPAPLKRHESPHVTAPEPLVWKEPESESDAAARRQRASAALTAVEARLQAISLSMATAPVEARAAMTIERVKARAERAEVMNEQARLKLWQAERGFAAPSGDKGPLWDVLRKCHRLLERMSGETPAFSDDIDACLDSIEYVIPRRFLDEPEAPKPS